MVAIDAYCTTFLGLNVNNIIMIRQAYEHDLGEINLDKLNIKEITI